jgi:hypothetical protein
VGEGMKIENEQRLIDANSFAEHLERMTKTAYPNLFPGLLEAIDYVKDFPTVDAVEVVRCKDCQWFNTLGCAIHIVDDSDKPKENDFCSFGERKNRWLNK